MMHSTRTPTPWMRFDDVIEAVEEWTGVSRTYLLGGAPSKRVVRARALLYGVLHGPAEMSNYEIAELTARTASAVSKILQRSYASAEEIEAVTRMARARIEDGEAHSGD